MSKAQVGSIQDINCVCKSELEDLCALQKKLSPYTKNYRAIYYKRHFIIDYFTDLHEKLRTCSKTLHLAISLFDNFMINVDLSSEKNDGEILDSVKITKISLVAFYVAFKFEESYYLTIDMVQKYFIKNSSVFSKEEFLNLEILLLKTLNFELQYVNLFSFHECFYDFIFKNIFSKEESDGESDNLEYKNFISDVMNINVQVMTILTNYKEIMFINEGNENFNSFKISDLAVVSLKISILFFYSNYEEKKQTSDQINQIVTEFFSVGFSENSKLNRCSFKLYSIFNDSIKKEERKTFKRLKEILKDLGNKL